MQKDLQKEENISLRNIFDLGWDGFLLSAYFTEEEKERRLMERGEWERKAYENITHGIRKDLLLLSIPVTYATEILIGELALNLILLSRLKFHIVHRSIVQEENVYKLDAVKHDKYQDLKDYGYNILYTKEGIHPVFDEFLFKLEKNINNQLRLLGLLPEQQLQRQKVQFIREYKQKLYEIENQKGDKTEVNMTIREET